MRKQAPAGKGGPHMWVRRRGAAGRGFGPALRTVRVRVKLPTYLHATLQVKLQVKLQVQLEVKLQIKITSKLQVNHKQNHQKSRKQNYM